MRTMTSHNFLFPPSHNSGPASSPKPTAVAFIFLDRSVQLALQFYTKGTRIAIHCRAPLAQAKGLKPLIRRLFPTDTTFNFSGNAQTASAYKDAFDGIRRRSCISLCTPLWRLRICFSLSESDTAAKTVHKKPSPGPSRTFKAGLSYSFRERPFALRAFSRAPLFASRSSPFPLPS